MCWEPPLLLLRILLLLLLGMMIVAINEKARPYYEDNSLKYIQKRESIPQKKNHTEPVKSLPKTTETTSTRDKVLHNTLTKRIYQGKEIKNPRKEAFSNIPRDKTKESLPRVTIEEAREGPQETNRLEAGAFSCYLKTDRKLEKGAQVEMAPFSQHSFARGGDLRHEDGRFLSRSSGLFMVSVTVHVKTEMLVIPGLKKKLKMKSKKVAKTQMKLQIVVNSKLKDRRSLSCSSVLQGQGTVQTLTATGIIQLEAGHQLSVMLQVTGAVHVLAGSHFSGVEV